MKKSDFFSVKICTVQKFAVSLSKIYKQRVTVMVALKCKK